LLRRSNLSRNGLGLIRLSDLVASLAFSFCTKFLVLLALAFGVGVAVLGDGNLRELNCR